MLAPPMPRLAATRTALVTLPTPSPDGTEGYSCVLFKDYLVLYGGQENGEISSGVFVYNLKKKTREQNSMFGAGPLIPRVFPSGCWNKESNAVMYCGGDDNSGRRPLENLIVVFAETRDGLQWTFNDGMTQTYLPSPISSMMGRKWYIYQPDQSNGNFGLLYCYDFATMAFSEVPGPKDEGIKELCAPSHNAIFSNGKLYLFAASGGKGNLNGFNTKDHLLEDVYVIDPTAGNPKWRKVSTGGQAPGQLTNISMTEGDGVIYIFGSKGEAEVLKACLWTFNTNDEEWNQVADVRPLTAKANQRAVIYNEQFLIINWSFVTHTIQVQQKNLSDLEFVVRPGQNKRMCKGEPDELVQDFQTLGNSKLFHDVVFEVEGEEIPAHKAILAYRSGYFMKIFTSGMSESHNTKIPVPNMKSQVFKALLQYVYCNEVELDEKLALDLIPIVDEYLMKGLKGLCERYLCKQLRKENVVDMLIVADRHEINELKNACFKFILKNLGNIDENEEMMKLSKPLFFELLKFQTFGPKGDFLFQKRFLIFKNRVL